MSRRPSAPPARATRARRTTPTAKASRSPRGAPQLAAGKPRRQHHAEAGGGVPGCANHMRGIVVIVSLLPVASKRGAQCHEEHTAYLPSDSPYPRGHVRSGMPTYRTRLRTAVDRWASTRASVQNLILSQPQCCRGRSRTRDRAATEVVTVQ